MENYLKKNCIHNSKQFVKVKQSSLSSNQYRRQCPKIISFDTLFQIIMIMIKRIIDKDKTGLVTLLIDAMCRDRNQTRRIIVGWICFN